MSETSEKRTNPGMSTVVGVKSTEATNKPNKQQANTTKPESKQANQKHKTRKKLRQSVQLLGLQSTTILGPTHF